MDGDVDTVAGSAEGGCAHATRPGAASIQEKIAIVVGKRCTELRG